MTVDKTGILLINVGTPDDTSTAAVRRYLRQFLDDARLLDMPVLARKALVHLIIAPFRAPKSAAAYKRIWTDQGSPLLLHTQNLAQKLEVALDAPDAPVVVEPAMAVGNPSVAAAIAKLEARGARRFVLAPLFPQQASATWGPTLDQALSALSTRWLVPPVATLPAFFADPAVVDAWATTLRPHVTAETDHVLFSFHGMPVRHLRKVCGGGCNADPNGTCGARETFDARCYMSQCQGTADAIAAALGLAEDAYSVTYQSRLGRDVWLTPATADTLAALPGRGVKNLVVATPSFVSDCLETLEEIGMEGKDAFLEAGGTAYTLAPCLNDHPAFVDALAALCRRSMTAITPRLPLLPAATSSRPSPTRAKSEPAHAGQGASA